MKNIFTDNKGFFQGGKSFGGRGFIEPLSSGLGALFTRNPNPEMEPEGPIIEDNSESGQAYVNQILPARRKALGLAEGALPIFKTPYQRGLQ